MFDTPVNGFADEAELAEALANYVVTCYKDAIEDRGRFTIAVTGGRALSLLAKLITREPFLSYIDWSKWYLFLVDDRCIDLSSPCSNYRIVDQELLRHVTIPELQVFPAYDPSVGLDDRGNTCEPAAVVYEHQIRAVLGEEGGFPVMDVVLLGVSPEGHVASFFPGHPAVTHQVRNYNVTWGAVEPLRTLGKRQAVTAMYECPLELVDISLGPEEWAVLRRQGGIPDQRVGLTVACVNAAREVIVTCTGPASAPLLREFFEGNPDPNRTVNLLKGQKGRPKVFADREAMATLQLPQLLRGFQVMDLAYEIVEKGMGRGGGEADEDYGTESEDGEEYANAYGLRSQEDARSSKSLLSGHSKKRNVTASDISETVERLEARVGRSKSAQSQQPGGGGEEGGGIEIFEGGEGETRAQARPRVEEEHEVVDEEFWGGEAKSEGDLVVPDDVEHLKDAVGRAIDEGRRLFVRLGQYEWEGEIEVTGKLIVVGESSPGGKKIHGGGPNSSPGVWACGRWAVRDGGCGGLRNLGLRFQGEVEIDDDCVLSVETPAHGGSFQLLGCAVLAPRSSKAISSGRDASVVCAKCVLGGTESGRNAAACAFEAWDAATATVWGSRLEFPTGTFAVSLHHSSTAAVRHTIVTHWTLRQLEPRPPVQTASDSDSSPGLALLGDSAGNLNSHTDRPEGEEEEEGGGRGGGLWAGDGNQAQVVVEGCWFTLARAALWSGGDPAAQAWVDGATDFQVDDSGRWANEAQVS